MESEWRLRGANRPPAYLALAVAVMAVAGFGIAGALAVGSAVANQVTKTLGSPVQLNAEKVTPQMSALLHGYGKVTKTTSTNWGGYADVASTVNVTLEAFAEYFVPTINCDAYPAINDNWVGIDGFASGTVEQAGTYGYCTSAGAGPYYYDWFEFYPYEGIYTVNAVSPGDLIQAYVLYNPYISVGGNYGIYTLIVDDISNPSASFSVQGNPSTCNSAGCESGPDTGAECISESLTDQGYYLPDYGTTTFYSCDAEINGHFTGIGGFPSSAHVTTYSITTHGYDSGKVQQKVSKLGTFDYKDDYFTITWKQYD